MEKSRCSDDNFDAIYKCRCMKMLCIKCYFSHIKKSPDHKIRRRRIPVNNESRQILINFVITLKERLILYTKPHIEWCVQKDLENYRNSINKIDFLLKEFDMILLFLIKPQFIHMKFILNPWEYFLYKTPDKASKYTTDLQIPESIEDFISISFQNNFLHFNYFIFEDPRYIFGWIYNLSDSNDDIFALCLSLIKQFLKTSEYEMAYEALQNFINLIHVTNKDYTLFNGFTKIIYDFILNKNISKVIELWKKEILSFKKKNYSYLVFYLLSWTMFVGLDQNDLASYCLQKLKKINLKQLPDKRFVLSQAILDWDIGNYEKAKKYFIKFVRQSKNSSDPVILRKLIVSYEKLAFYYSDHNKQDKLKKIIKAVSKIAESYKNNLEIYEPLLIFYITTEDYDNLY